MVAMMVVISVENIYLREALAGMAAIATLERFAATRMRGKSKLEELLAQPPSLLLPPPPSVESSILACQLDSYSASGVSSLTVLRCLAKASVWNARNRTPLSLLAWQGRQWPPTQLSWTPTGLHFGQIWIQQLWGAWGETWENRWMEHKSTIARTSGDSGRVRFVWPSRQS